MRLFSLIVFCLSLLIAAVSAKAGEVPQFMFPAGCTRGGNCWIVNYVDADPAQGKAADFRCGTQTYDSHDGTDIGLRDAAAIKNGVDVLAAGDGTVLRVRDEMEDMQPSPEDMDKMLAGKRGCGNGVLIDHGDGWQTIYCHMKKGGIFVKPQQKVRIGEALGLTGQSGAAEFPHVHFGVIHNGKIVDPFTGQESDAGCDARDSAPLWRPELNLSYVPFSFYAAGFASDTPDFEQIKQNAQTPETLAAAHLPALTFWIGLYGATLGDKIHIEIIAPDGAIFAQRDIVQDKNRARQFYFIGKKSSGAPFPPGTYTGRATLIRADLTGDLVSQLTLTP